MIYVFGSVLTFSCLYYGIHRSKSKTNGESVYQIQFILIPCLVKSINGEMAQCGTDTICVVYYCTVAELNDDFLILQNKFTKNLQNNVLLFHLDIKFSFLHKLDLH